MFGSILEESALLSIGVRSLKTCIARARFLIATSGPCACMLYCRLLEFYLVSFIHLVCIVGSQFRSRLSLESHSWRRVGGRLIRADSYPSSDSSVEMSDELASTLASIQEFMAGTAQTRPPGVSLGTPFHLADHYETIPPPTVTVPPPMVPTIEDTRLAEQEAKVERLESMMRQIRLQDGGLTWDDRDGIPAASLPAKFRMPDIELEQLRWFASVEPSRLRTWEDVAREFLTQFAFSADIDVSRRELEATRQRPEESISSFVTRWRAKVAGMVDRPKEQDQIDMVLRNLQPRYYSSPDSKGKKLIGPLVDLERLALLAISIGGASLSLYLLQSELLSLFHSISISRIMLRSLTLLRLACSHDLRIREPLLTATQPYAQRPARQFTPLGMTLTRAFEKLRDAGVIVPLAPRPLPHPIPPHFRYMSTACIIRFRGTILSIVQHSIMRYRI
ncbi:hypothetical protein CK203_057474 [Vitis vinifera]|uniref:Retrotransposon gag domain-containing protein n=1 Tax=Vitis vinifera TaxID=29760 RepID=A0A438FE82_VITVI|nr:hypothetical protein CK203_114613 [Vitis vinifera]RVW72998.1 hypothetical protein CK203_057474 [Vitis vinifera]